MRQQDLVAGFVLAWVAGVAFGQQCNTELMSRAPWGWTGNGPSIASDISDDGRFAVLNTQATDLFDWTFDGNSFTSFLAGHDRLTGNVFAFEGNILYPGNAIIVDPISARIANSNTVVFDTLRDYTGNKFRGYWQSGNRVPDHNGFSDVYVRSLDIGGVSRVTVGYLGDDADGPSSNPDTDAWGYYVVYQSEAGNLIPGDTNGVSDIFLSYPGYPSYWPYLISVGVGGSQANGPSSRPAVSNYGDVVAFQSDASNLIAGDTNRTTDVFVAEQWWYQTHIERVSVSRYGTQADGPSGSCDISADGSMVCFASLATNLVGGDTNGVSDIFVHYREYGFTRRVSVSTSGQQADYSSFAPRISSSGRYVVFSSNATNLVSGDTNGLPDAFVHDLWTGQTARASVAFQGDELDGASTAAGVDSSGTEILFTSDAANHGWPDVNGADDALLRVRACEIVPFCLADFRFDGVVDTRDFVAFLDAWANSDPRGDADGNLVFDTRDFIFFLDAWANGC